ncbi:AraC family transcriptional regulator [bacterium]|nr:AraC family transcriptional regulator [bacterium]
MTDYNFYRFKKPLSDYFSYAWSLKEIKLKQFSCSEKLVPIGFAQIMFNFGGTMRLSNNGLVNKIPIVSVSGIFTKDSDIIIDGLSDFIIVFVKPNAIKQIFNISANEIAKSYEDAKIIIDNDINFLSEKLYDLNDFNSRIKIIENYFLRKIFKNSFLIDERVSRTVSLLSENCFNIKISNIAKEIYTTERTLERVFNENVGVSLIDFKKIMRFQKILLIKQKNPEFSLTRVAFQAGYSDQSHFINDFKSIVGLTPSNYFKKYDSISEYFF